MKKLFSTLLFLGLIIFVFFQDSVDVRELSLHQNSLEVFGIKIRSKQDHKKQELKNQIAEDSKKKNYNLESIEKYFEGYETDDLKSELNNSRFLKRLEELITKSNQSNLSQDEKDELTILMLEKGVIHKIIIDRILEDDQKINS